MYQLFLASESPRRRQLLEQAGFVFSVIPVKVSEIPNKNLNVDQQIIDIAGRKAHVAMTSQKSSLTSPFIILSADTEVVFNDTLLGKPVDALDAFRMLKMLSGKIHEVKTAFVMIESINLIEFSQIETTRVQFHDLTDNQIQEYIATNEPMDKAGSYAIQGLGRKLVNKFHGSYENVVGLPTQGVISALQKMQWLIKK
jgi:septum formation protein